ncbi:hypothetical protein P7K49_015105 [Saguinus oedipus]|uniref:Uncharacterized protein n=1 Tax=Saguinus oedipus TaxID=9490 RepID=A0ABQ9V8U8_SAGOE|nr:hypothetical protein P7K49_015105 [Saguinus oedipus]
MLPRELLGRGWLGSAAPEDSQAHTHGSPSRPFSSADRSPRSSSGNWQLLASSADSGTSGSWVPAGWGAQLADSQAPRSPLQGGTGLTLGPRTLTPQLPDMQSKLSQGQEEDAGGHGQQDDGQQPR